MSFPRLPFLYPQVFNPSRAWEAYTTLGVLPKARKPHLHRVQRSSCVRRTQGSSTQRYGSATGPGLPPPKAGKDSAAEPRNETETPPTTRGSDRDEKADKKKRSSSPAKKESAKRSGEGEPIAADTGGKQSSATQNAKPRTDVDTHPDRPAPKSSTPVSALEPTLISKPGSTPAEFLPSSPPSIDDVTKAAASASTSGPAQTSPENASASPEGLPPLESARMGASKPLEKVLYMEAPTGMSSAAVADPHGHKSPHMQPPPYVHHFDTYTLVKDLAKNGFTQDQSVTIMKAIRSLLAVNLDIAKEGLVSKSDVENETYLFRAASSELRTEIQNARRRTSEAQRSDRSHLQHDVDILSQEVTQKTQALRDELKGMFDDRKMAVRTEQREMESAIQEINRKISVILLGEGKGEVEGLRWFLTRRVAMFIGSAAVFTIAYMRYSTYQAHLEEQARERSTKASSGTQTDYGPLPPTSSVSGGGPGLRGGLADTDAVLATAEDVRGGKGGEGVGYVSLG